MSVFCGLPLFWKRFLLMHVRSLCTAIKKELDGNSVLFLYMLNALRKRSWQIYKILRGTDRLPDEEYKIWKQLFPFCVAAQHFTQSEDLQLDVYVQKITQIIDEAIHAYKASFPVQRFEKSNKTLLKSPQSSVFFQLQQDSKLRTVNRRKQSRASSSQHPKSESMLLHFSVQ